MNFESKDLKIFKDNLLEEIHTYLINELMKEIRLHLTNELNKENKKLLSKLSYYKRFLNNYLEYSYPSEDMEVLNKYGCVRKNTCVMLTYNNGYLYRIEIENLKPKLLPMWGSNFSRVIPITELRLNKNSFKQFVKDYKIYNKKLKEIKKSTIIVIPKDDTDFITFLEEINNIYKKKLGVKVWDKICRKVEKKVENYVKKTKRKDTSRKHSRALQNI